MSEVVKRPSYSGADVYWYEVSPYVIIGLRGLTEFKIPYWDITRAADSFAWKNKRQWDYNEAFEWAVEWAAKESEYVEFEDVKPNILLLGLGNTGDETNETK